MFIQIAKLYFQAFFPKFFFCKIFFRNIFLNFFLLNPDVSSLSSFFTLKDKNVLKNSDFPWLFLNSNLI